MRRIYMNTHMQNRSGDLIAPTTVSFLSGGQRCVADYFQPMGAGPLPVIVLGHGLGGTRAMRLRAFAERFAAAGYACVAFDYRHFGDSEGSPRQLLDIQRQLDDWRAALAYARSLPDIDPKRVIIWGASFGAGHALTVAANDTGLAAVIVQCPFTDGLSASLAMNPLTSLNVIALALRDRLSQALGGTPVTVPLFAPPGETALMNSADAYAGCQALMPADGLVLNYVAARVALDIVFCRPGRQTPKIQAPVLFCVCNGDTVAPAKATLRHAKRTPRHEIKRYDEGHFDIFVGKGFEQVISDQLEFLKRTVPT